MEPLHSHPLSCRVAEGEAVGRRKLHTAVWEYTLQVRSHLWLFVFICAYLCLILLYPSTWKER